MTAPGDASERREDPRAPIELKIEYTRQNVFFADYARDISHGGIFIRTRDLLEVGTLFAFQLHVPGLAEPLVLTGEVRWVLTQGDTGMGIQFLYRDDEERRTLERTVERLMKDSMGEALYTKLMNPAGGGR